MPLIRDAKASIPVRLNVVPHRQSNIVFVVERARHKSNRTPRNNFFDEDDPSPHFSPYLASYVESQVNFIKIRVHWNRHAPEQFSFQKLKSDEADKGLLVPAIKFSASRNKWTEQIRFDFIIEHCQILPMRGEKCFVGIHLLRMFGEGYLIQRKRNSEPTTALRIVDQGMHAGVSRRFLHLRQLRLLLIQL